MSGSKLHDWIQAMTGVALVIGLVLVIIEIRQSAILATLQLTQDTYAESHAFQRQMMGENPGPVLTKACLDPGALTDAEIRTAMYWIDHRYDAIMAAKLLAEIADTEEFWRYSAEWHLRAILSTPMGRAEFEQFNGDPRRWDPEVAEMARQILESGDYIPCERLFEEWRKGLQSESDRRRASV